MSLFARNEVAEAVVGRHMVSGILPASLLVLVFLFCVGLPACRSCDVSVRKSVHELVFETRLLRGLSGGFWHVKKELFHLHEMFMHAEYTENI